MEEKYILSLDIGTTTIRSFIYNSRGESVGKSSDQTILHYPQHGFVEIDPDELWDSIVHIVEKALQDAGLSAGQMTALGISTQRSTFITWSRLTGKPFHRFITWNDLRADKLVKNWNDSFTWKTTLRFSWALQNITALRNAVEANDAMFGTLDTWLLYKLTGRKVHITDVSSASATGFFDPFVMQWATWAMSFFSIPISSLPTVVDTAGDHFTSTDPSIWGVSIPIRSSMADQTASMWGSCCFEPGDTKLTMGTGTFFNINTGTSPEASISGFYPVVGWRVKDDLVYVMEGSNNDTGSIITWAQSVGLFDKPADSADIAMSVKDSDGVYFIPAFSGLGPPYNDTTAASGFLGVKASTTKAHLVRAVLESIAFRTAQICECARAETKYQFHHIRLDGGVSNNDFVAQLVADLTGLRVERPHQVEMSSLGCAYITGLQLGLWKTKKELQSLRKVGRAFTPRPAVRNTYTRVMARWEEAVKRFSDWYVNESSGSGAAVADSAAPPVRKESTRVNLTKKTSNTCK
ncbi:Putative glycerol kinase 5 [Eumeta japonica]|uniref:Glycerol kinase 5 n=1 Tax=Eumeta variegata TaxID=151549 RepID=A0A4C1UZM5_EUMVA|nr:Putative glycerol kinase 5 [Eumeta japonica]